MAHDRHLPFQRRLLPLDVGTRIRAARLDAGTSRRDVAAAAGMAPRTLARIERGAQKPLWPTLERLCQVLGIGTFSIAGRWASDAIDLPELGSTPGVALRLMRKSRGLTLVEVAAAAGVSPATLSRFERGIYVARALTNRPGFVGAAYADRDVVLASDRLASALGFGDVEELRSACRSLELELRDPE